MAPVPATAVLRTHKGRRGGRLSPCLESRFCTEPQRHSHFFTRDGHFGSVDQYGQQVDNGRYRVLSASTFRIGDVRFHYQVESLFARKVLALKPVITRRMRRQALAHPLQFSDAGWSVAVTYPGSTWKRVRCGPWC
jgi:hypothetical protein